MANKSIVIRIKSALDAAGISATKQQVDQMAKSIAASNAEAAKKSSNSWTEFYNKFKVISGAIKAAWSAVKYALSESFRFEEQTRQFKFLTGSIDEAKAHMADLKALGDTPPFSIDQFAAASRSMMVMSDGALGYKKSLEMIGDAAAAVGVPVEQMGHAIGRLYALIRDGQPVSRATMELRNMGVITPEVAAELDKLQKSGASNAEIWAAVERSLGRFNGAMAETESTGNGLMGAISSRWQNLVRQFGDAFLESAEGGMKSVLDAMKELEKSGAIERWADSAVSSIQEVGGAVKWLSSIVGTVGGVFSKIWKSTVGVAVAFGAGADQAAFEGRGFFDQIKNGAAVAKEMWNQTWNGGDDEEDERQNAERRALERAKRERRRAAETARDAERAAAEELRIKEQLAASQRKLDEERAKKAQEEAQKAADAELKARQKAEDELHKQRIANIQAELKAREAGASALEKTASTAQSEFDRQFALYRDPEKAKEAIAEEKDYQADLKRLRKDAERYGGKWRIDELSSLMSAGDMQGVADTLNAWRKSSSFTPEVEAMVRASAADQTRTTAEDELRQINANTKDLSDKLDQLLQVK